MSDVVWSKVHAFAFDRRNQVTAFLIILGLLLWLTVAEFLKAIFFLGALLFVNYYVAYLLRPMKRFRIGIELTLLGTVVAGIAYGAQVGAIFGAVSAIVNYIGYKRISSFFVVVIPTYMLIGATAHLFASASLAQVGVLYAILYNVIITPIIMIYMNARLSKCLWFSTTNVVFNYLVFAKLAPLLVLILS